MSKEINLNLFKVTDFQKMFNMNTSGFSTGDNKTHGKMTLTAGGRLVNWGRYDRGHTDYEALEGNGKEAKENYRVRYALVQALKNGGASKDWIGKLGLLKSTDAAFDGNSTAKPLSRRTIKSILKQYQLHRTDALPKDTEHMKTTLERLHNITDNVAKEMNINENNIAKLPFKTIALCLPEIVTKLSIDLEGDGVETVTADFAKDVIDRQVQGCKQTLLGKFLEKLKTDYHYQGAGGVIRKESENMLCQFKKRCTSPVYAQLYGAIVDYVLKGLGDSAKEEVEKEAAENPKVANVKQDGKGYDLKHVLNELGKLNLGYGGANARIDVVSNVGQVGVKLYMLCKNNATDELVEDVFKQLVAQKSNFTKALDAVKKDKVHYDSNMRYIRAAKDEAPFSVVKSLYGAAIKYLEGTLDAQDANDPA